MTSFYGSLAIVPLARVGYEMIDSQLGPTHFVGYNLTISNKRGWNNCFIKIKNNQEILLDPADFILQEQPTEDNSDGHYLTCMV